VLVLLIVKLVLLQYAMFPVLKELERDQSEEPFGDLDSSAKLQLLRTFCDLLLFVKQYKAVRDDLEKSIEASNSLIHEHETEIMMLLGMSEDEVAEKLVQTGQRLFEFKEVKNSA
jgi:hypothetical protein